MPFLKKISFFHLISLVCTAFLFLFLQDDKFVNFDDINVYHSNYKDVKCW